MKSTLEIAINRAACLQPDELASIIDPTTASIKALAMGQGSHDDWAIARSAYIMALAIEQSGIVRGQLPAIKHANDCLSIIYNRATTPQANGWIAPTLSHIEREALYFLCDLYRIQLNHLSRGELARISKKAIATLKTQRAHVERMAA